MLSHKICFLTGSIVFISCSESLFFASSRLSKNQLNVQPNFCWKFLFHSHVESCFWPTFNLLLASVWSPPASRGKPLLTNLYQNNELKEAKKNPNLYGWGELKSLLILLILHELKLRYLYFVWLLTSTGCFLQALNYRAGWIRLPESFFSALVCPSFLWLSLCLPSLSVSY